MIDNRKIAIVVSWAITVFWMVLIFNLSAQPAEESNELSLKATEIIIGMVNRVVSVDADDIKILNMANGFHYSVRKYAHFFIYFVLGILLMNAFRKSQVSQRKIILLSFGICVIYAITDELHQVFVPGRSGQLTDILIDSAGAALGVMCYLIVSRRRLHSKNLRKR